MTTEYDQEQLAAAGACFAQASRLLYCEPDTEEWPLRFESACSRLRRTAWMTRMWQRGLACLDAWCVEAARVSDADGCRAFDERAHGLKREWFRLFVGAGTPDAPCWESFYLEPNSQMFGEKTLEVRAAVPTSRTANRALHAEPDDHLGLMLGFMGHLCGVEADALADGQEDAARVAADEQKAFLAEHVLPWLAVWRYAVEKNVDSDYYRGVGAFAFGLCARYAGASVSHSTRRSRSSRENEC